jgi:predicted CXXCH cytochrome family protein
VADKEDLCGGCHDLNDAAIVTAHSGFEIATSDCQNCHEPHASVKGVKGLLKPRAHPPFDDGDCSICHSAKKGTALNGSVQEVCAGCHDVGDRAKMMLVSHPPVEADDGCVSCHGPHVGHGNALLLEKGPRVCLNCHNDAEFTGRIQHAVAFEDCTTCHEPHGSNNTNLLIDSDVMGMCMGCHDDAKETHFHPMGEGTIDPRTRQNVNCVSCHTPHSSEFEALLTADKNRKLCVTCHDLAH